jgi:hypothetical protein
MEIRTRGVVASNLVVAGPSRPGSHRATGRFQGDGLESCGKIRTDWTRDAVQEGCGGGSDTKIGIGGDDDRAEV